MLSGSFLSCVSASGCCGVIVLMDAIGDLAIPIGQRFHNGIDTAFISGPDETSLFFDNAPLGVLLFKGWAGGIVYRSYHTVGKAAPAKLYKRGVFSRHCLSHCPRSP